MKQCPVCGNCLDITGICENCGWGENRSKIPKLFGLHFLVWAGILAGTVGPLVYWGICSSPNRDSQIYGQVFVVYPSIFVGVVLVLAGLAASWFDGRK